jgi:hypothetical protein
VSDEPNPFETIFNHYAERLRDAPGAAGLARLARTAKFIPDALLAHLATLGSLNSPGAQSQQMAIEVRDQHGPVMEVKFSFEMARKL